MKLLRCEMVHEFRDSKGRVWRLLYDKIDEGWRGDQLMSATASVEHQGRCAAVQITGLDGSSFACEVEARRVLADWRTLLLRQLNIEIRFGGMADALKRIAEAKA